MGNTFERGAGRTESYSYTRARGTFCPRATAYPMIERVRTAAWQCRNC